MTDYLPTLYGGVLPSRVERQVSRAVRADAARIARTTETTKLGMRAARSITTEEVILAHGDPVAEARVRAVADRGVAAVANIVEGVGSYF